MENTEAYGCGAFMQQRLRRLPELLLPWFREHARALPWRADREPYHVWLSEIMLQQTRVEAVKGYYTRFLRALPDIAALAAADAEHLAKLWEGLGYYSRMRNLQAAARIIMTKYGGVFPSEYAAIRALPGVGDYTAGAVASICFGLPEPAVDGNVLRVLSRLTGDARPVNEEKTKAAAREALREVYPPGDCGAFTQALMELGAMVCVPNGAPECPLCPVASLCSSKGGGWKQLPVRTAKKERRQEKLTVFLLYCGGAFALRKRPASGLLAGLWEFPNVPGELTPEAAAEQAAAWGVHPRDLVYETRARHIFTHVEWDMLCFRFDCAEAAGGFVWAEDAALDGRYALPTAFRKLRGVPALP